MHPRLEEEWPAILEAYPDAEHREPPEHFEIRVELESGGYSAPATPLAVLVPAGYRATGPDGFLVPVGLTFADRSSLPFTMPDASGAGMPGWALVSFHCIDEQGLSTWRPTADPERGDNFVGYLQSVEAFLAKGCN